MASDTFTVSRALTKLVTNPETGARTRVPDGREICTVEVNVDLEVIAVQLGSKAAKNKNGRSTAQYGAIRVRVTERKRAP